MPGGSPEFRYDVPSVQLDHIDLAGSNPELQHQKMLKHIRLIELSKEYLKKRKHSPGKEHQSIGAIEYSGLGQQPTAAWLNAQVTSGLKAPAQTASPHEPYRLIHPLGKQKVLKSSHQRSLDLKNLNMKKKLLEGMLQHQKLGAHAALYSPTSLAQNQTGFGQPQQILALRQRVSQGGSGAGRAGTQGNMDAGQNQVEILVQYPTSPNVASPFSGWDAGLRPAEDSLAVETAAVAGKDIEAVLDSKDEDVAAEAPPRGAEVHATQPSVTVAVDALASASARFGPPGQARIRPQAKGNATGNTVEAQGDSLARYGIIGVAAPAAPSAKAAASRQPAYRPNQRPPGLRGVRDKDLNICVGTDLRVVRQDSQPGSSAPKSPMLRDNV